MLLEGVAAAAAALEVMGLLGGSAFWVKSKDLCVGDVLPLFWWRQAYFRPGRESVTTNSNSRDLILSHSLATTIDFGKRDCEDVTVLAAQPTITNPCPISSSYSLIQGGAVTRKG